MSGYTSLGANSGQKVFQVLQHQNVDFILSDAIMPECSGINFSSNFKRNTVKKKYLALMTGFSSNQEICKNRDITILESRFPLQI